MPGWEALQRVSFYSQHVVHFLGSVKILITRHAMVLLQSIGNQKYSCSAHVEPLV